MQRRTLLKASLPVAIGALALPRGVLGAYPEQAFLANEIADALRETVGTADIGDSDRVAIIAPDIASDARLIPVRIESALENIESISLLVAGNEQPLTAHYRLYLAQSFVSTRIRMEKSGELLAVVRAAGALHTARRQIRVSGRQCES